MLHIKIFRNQKFFRSGFDRFDALNVYCAMASYVLKLFISTNCKDNSVNISTDGKLYRTRVFLL